ncbi:MAG: hypothetical protein ACK50Q_17170 [Labrys sp. (in: a-proteobacteria)]
MVKRSFAQSLSGRIALSAMVVCVALTASTAAQARGGLLEALFGSFEPARPAVDVPFDAPSAKPAKPKVKKVKRAVETAMRKQAPLPEVAAFTDPTQQILHDPSLRRGDVVMFPTGPKVFIAKSKQGPWTEADFEDVAGSKALSSGARDMVVAATENARTTPDLVIETIIPAVPVKVASSTDTPIN